MCQFYAVHKTLNLNTFTWKRKCWMDFTFFSCNLDIIHRHTDVCIVRARAYKCYLQEGISSLVLVPIRKLIRLNDVKPAWSLISPPTDAKEENISMTRGFQKLIYLLIYERHLSLFIRACPPTVGVTSGKF